MSSTARSEARWKRRCIEQAQARNDRERQREVLRRWTAARRRQPVSPPSHPSRRAVRRWMRGADVDEGATVLAQSAVHALDLPEHWLDDETHWIWDEALRVSEEGER